MNLKPLMTKIASGRSLSRKLSEQGSAGKTRCSSAESSAKISLKSILLRKSKENLLPKDKPPCKARPCTHLQRLDLNIKEIHNSFYKNLQEIESKLHQHCHEFLNCENCKNYPRVVGRASFSPIKSRY